MLASLTLNRLARWLRVLGLGASLAMIPCRLPAETTPSPSQAPRIVDGIIAKVNGEPVFLRELRAGYWLAPGTAGRPWNLQEEMGRLIDRTLLIQEAERLRMGSEHPQELARETQRKARDVAARAGARKIAVSREEIAEWVASETAIRVLKEKRIGLLVVVTDSEVEDYYEAHRAEFNGAPLGSVRARVVDRVFRSKFDVQVDRWFTSLKRRSQVEIFLEEAPWKTFDFKAYVRSGP